LTPLKKLSFLTSILLKIHLIKMKPSKLPYLRIKALFKIWMMNIGESLICRVYPKIKKSIKKQSNSE
jgi:hypothetical protein